jgi:hypothetical protein
MMDRALKAQHTALHEAVPVSLLQTIMPTAAFQMRVNKQHDTIVCSQSRPQ